MPSKEKNILFVCVENAGRSQMAHAFAILYGQKAENVFSGGSKPSGVINPKAIQVMKELGYNLSTHRSKSLLEIPNMEFDYLITMGCGDSCGNFRAKNRIDWDLKDPKNLPIEEVRKIRDDIGAKVKELLLF
jgi:protein-tyrosine-phosphatase